MSDHASPGTPVADGASSGPDASARRRELVARVGVAAVGIPVFLGAVALGGWVLGGLMAVVAALASGELFRLAEARGLRPFRAIGMAAAAGLVLVSVANPTPAELAPWSLAVFLPVALFALAVGAWTRGPEGEPLASAGVTLLGIVYVGGTLAFVPILRWLPSTAPGALTGNVWHASSFLLLPVLVTWVGDTAAYSVGRRWGRARLAPAVSPGKTVLGSVAGLVGSMLAAMGVSWLALARLPFLTVPVWMAAWIGLLLGVAGQAGDLAESVLKREAGVKDSGGLLPGHGGVLDRFDSLFFAIPSTWVLLWLGGVLR